VDPGATAIWNHPRCMTSSRNQEQEDAHDVLAAEAFAVPAPDPALHHVTPPDDASGITEAHDILAAEEFAMPAPGARRGAGAGAAAGRHRSKLADALAAGVGLLAAILLRGRRSR
jgi:hypothetical protein